MNIDNFTMEKSLKIGEYNMFNDFQNFIIRLTKIWLT